MKITEALSEKGISAMLEAVEIGKEEYGKEFYSAKVTRLLKNGFWADVETKDGEIHKIRAKHKGNLTVIS